MCQLTGCFLLRLSKGSGVQGFVDICLKDLAKPIVGSLYSASNSMSNCTGPFSEQQLCTIGLGRCPDWCLGPKLMGIL